jgi:hypothetical protein
MTLNRIKYFGHLMEGIKEVLKSKDFIETVNLYKDCKLSCVGNHALDASGLWKF